MADIVKGSAAVDQEALNPKNKFIPVRHDHSRRDRPLAPPDFVFPGLRSAKVGLLVGPGGVSKSQLAMQIAAQIASGGAADLSGFGLMKGGRAVVFAGEEDHDDLDHRLLEIDTRLNQMEREELCNRLDVHSLVASTRSLDVLNSQCLEELVRYCGGARLVIFDTLRRIHCGEENDSGHMSHVIAALEFLAAQVGCAVLVLHHVAKGAIAVGAGATQHAARGSTVPAREFMVHDVLGQEHWFAMSAGQYVRGIVAKSGRDSRLYVVIMDPPPDQGEFDGWPRVVTAL